MIGKKAWKEAVNENILGSEPFAFGYAEQTKALVVRKRDAE
jgi:hypothetical protein